MAVVLHQLDHPGGRTRRVEAELLGPHQHIDRSAVADGGLTVVIEVHGEPWANGLRPATWLGTRVDGLLALVGDALGTSPVVAVTGLGERLVEAKVTSDSMALRVAMGRWQSDVGEVLDGLVSRIDR